MSAVTSVFQHMGLSSNEAAVLTMVTMIVITIALAVVTRGAVLEEAGGMAADEAEVDATTAQDSIAAGAKGAEEGAKAGEDKGGATSLQKLVANMEAGSAAQDVMGNSNNCIEQGMLPILEKMGFDPKATKMIAMIMQMLTMMVIGIAAGGGLKGMSDVAQEMASAGEESTAALMALMKTRPLLRLPQML